MSCCSHCQDSGRFFNFRTAKKELRRYKRKGPNKSTRLLLDEIRKKDLNGKSLLDIGGGVGAISFELLHEGIISSHHVDASTSYLNISENEAKNRGVHDRIQYQFGDFTELSDEIDMADLVTLDRVICCYPYMEKLVDRSAEKARLYYGVVFPREWWFINVGMRAGNFYFKVRGMDFRTYLHPPDEIDARIRSNGFQEIRHMQTIIWNVFLYERIK